MTNQEKDKIKRISIRGRFAYGLLCLEKLTAEIRFESEELKSLITQMWKVTDSEKLGWWQDLLIENNPRVVIGDYELIKSGKTTFEACGYATIVNLDDFEKRVRFMCEIPFPIPELLDKLSAIVNQNLFAGCGEYSEATFQPTIELIEILDSITNFKRPNVELLEFSNFRENSGWGNKFTRDMITTN